MARLQCRAHVRGDRDLRTDEVLRQDPGHRGPRPRREHRRGFRIPRPERRRQVDHDPYAAPLPAPDSRDRARRGFDNWKNVEELADRFSLDLDRRVGSYSTGNRRKVGIVQAFMHEPELLVLDEPTTGLDPLMQQEFFALIDEVRADGRTVFLSSHVLPEVERLADRVGIVRQSRLVMVEEVETLKEKALRRIEIVFARRVDAKAFASLPGVREAAGSGHRLDLAVEGSLDAVMREAAAHGIVNVTTHEADLEEVFMGYYKGDDAAGS
jgi:ABC-2 type transport system ATP-binding protein